MADFRLIILKQMEKSMKPFLRTREVCKLIGVCRPTLEGWRRTGYGPKFYVIGKHYHYRLEDVEAFIADCIVDPAAPQASETNQ